jgi:uncharacterized LabA/DUF88 family protein
MVQHKEQRVGVFVDVQNMYYSAKSLHGRKINFGNILKTAVADRMLIRAIAYVIKTDERDKEHFYDGLEKLGYEIRAKDVTVFHGGAKKGDWDVGIAMDVMRLAAKLDVVVLVSGDGDFQDLLEHAKSLGCRTEVIAFGGSCSSKLRESAHLVVDMDKEPDTYLLGAMPTRGKEGKHEAKLVPIELKGEAAKGPAPKRESGRGRGGRGAAPKPESRPEEVSYGEAREPQLTDLFDE